MNCTYSKDKPVIEKITPDKILNLKNISFLEKEQHPVSQSYSVLCTMTAVALVNQFTNYILDRNHKSVRNIFYLNDLQSVVFEAECRENCGLCH